MTSRTLLLLVLASLAIILYVIGFKTGTLAIFILAVLVELGFWFKLLASKKRNNSNH